MNAERVVLVDYGMGNVGSIVNMLARLGVEAHVSGDTRQIEGATRLILPGVGAFDGAMRRIREAGLREVLDRKVLHERTPIIGLCLGMQLLTEKSDEGVEPGLGWIRGDTVRFDAAAFPGLKVPHMGWNFTRRVRSDELLTEFDSEPRFYYVHSYHIRAADPEDVVLTARHGVEFPAAVHRDNIFGVQFHPEKSHSYGMKLLSGFLNFRTAGRAEV